MTTVALLTLRALGRGRRLLVIGLLLAVPALLALAYDASESQPDGQRFAVQLFDTLVLPVLLPLTALTFATSALGSEVEDRTLLYLTLRPISRLSIVLGKLLAATAIIAGLTELSVLALYLVAGTHSAGAPPGAHDGNVLGPLASATLLGSLAYGALFLLVGLAAPRRGLLGGFVYVLVWEGIAAGLSGALATFSIRRYVQGTLDAGLGAGRLGAIQLSDLSGVACSIVLAVIVLLSIAATTTVLRRIQLP